MLTQSQRIRIKSVILSGLSPDTISSVIESLITESLKLQPYAHNYEQVLISAAEYIFAYLDLGFSYLDHSELFDHVLSSTGYTDQDIQLLRQRNRVIIPNKAQLQQLLGRWPASPYNSHTKVDAINEIIEHVSTMSPGDYWYYTAKKDGTYTTLVILQIFNDCAIIHDVKKNKFYRLIK